MLGAIIGDIIGSAYEWRNIKTKEFPLFCDDCSFTDDTLMTLAVADALMKGATEEDFIDSMKEYGRMYPDAGYGARFAAWINGNSSEPYNSFGNGAAMRVSPCGWQMDCNSFARTGAWPADIRNTAVLSAAVTHNHPEGIKGALATVDSIFLCRLYSGHYRTAQSELIFPTIGDCKQAVKNHISKEYGYNLDRQLSVIRPNYSFDESCQGTVPEAIIAFLESIDYEDAVRNAVSLGGDSDTLAAITGSIAEAAYGIPDWIKISAWLYLDEPLREICRRWKKFYSENCNSML